MEIYLEELENKDGFITVLDDDGLVTIQMSEEGVKKIVDTFDSYIIEGLEHRDIVQVKESDEVFDLDLSLKNDGDGFHLTGSRFDTDNYYHDFELEYCDIKTWNKIKKLITK